MVRSGPRPNQTHTVVTAGYDRFSCIVGKFVAYASKDQDSLISKAFRVIQKYSGIGSITSNTCATAARTSDGSLVIVYMPTIRTITLDMSKLTGTTQLAGTIPRAASTRTLRVPRSPMRGADSLCLQEPTNLVRAIGSWSSKREPRAEVQSPAFFFRCDGLRLLSRLTAIIGRARQRRLRSFATGLTQRQARAWSAMPPKAEVS
jgi:hypothetical protein